MIRCLSLGGAGKLDCHLAVACERITNLAQFGPRVSEPNRVRVRINYGVTLFMTDLCTLFQATWKLHEILFSIITLFSIIHNCSKAGTAKEMSSMKASIFKFATRSQPACAHKSFSMLHQQGHMQASRSTGYTVSAQSME
jgi:hypothetical protein